MCCLISQCISPGYKNIQQMDWQKQHQTERLQSHSPWNHSSGSAVLRALPWQFYRFSQFFACPYSQLSMTECLLDVPADTELYSLLISFQHYSCFFMVFSCSSATHHVLRVNCLGAFPSDHHTWSKQHCSAWVPRGEHTFLKGLATLWCEATVKAAPPFLL